MPALQHLQVPELADDDEEGGGHDGGDRHDAALPGVAAPGKGAARRRVRAGGPHAAPSLTDSTQASASTTAAPRKPL